MTTQRHTKAVALANHIKHAEKELLDVLMAMREANEFQLMGYRNLYDYVLRGLRMSEAQACYYSQVARTAEKVPALKEAVDEGTLTLSQARRLVPVITQQNAPQWIEKAASLPQRELERAVSEMNPNAIIREKIRPVAIDRAELRVGVSNSTEAKLKRAQDLLSQKLRRPVSLEEAIAHLAEHFLDREDPVRKAERAKTREPEPRAATPTSGRRPIPAAIRHAVNLRDGGQCVHRYPDGTRCAERRWVDLHHVVEVARGGPNTVDNLITLCSGHHGTRHHAVRIRRAAYEP